MKRLALVFLLACGNVESPRVPEAPRPRTESTPPSTLIEIGFDGVVCVVVDGEVHCGDGDDRDGPLGRAPVVPGVSGAVSIALGGGFGCAVVDHGEVKCWGRNENGQLGAGSREATLDTAVSVKNLAPARSVFAGTDHVCAILESGGVSCWGANDFGQTGADVVYLPQARELVHPTPVPAVDGAKWGMAFETRSCVMTKDHGIVCWGTPDGPAPKATDIVPPIVGARAGMLGTCGITDDQRVLCWDRHEPLREIRGLRATRIAVGGRLACATTTSAEVRCWGTWRGHGASERKEAVPVAVRIR